MELQLVGKSRERKPGISEAKGRECFKKERVSIRLGNIEIIDASIRAGFMEWW
jgi:hypothetical protein